MTEEKLDDPRLMDPVEVRHFLSQTGHDNPFTIIFLRNDGTQKIIQGATTVHSDKPPKNPNVVPVKDPGSERGWGSFYLDRVLSIYQDTW